MKAVVTTTKRAHDKIRSILLQRGFITKSVDGTRLEFTGAAPNVVAVFTELRHSFPAGYVSGYGAPEKRWIVLCCAEFLPTKARCFDDRDDALAWAKKHNKLVTHIMEESE